MTNQEKFIEVMNEYFDAELTKENFRIIHPCTPCGVYRKGACAAFSCNGCGNWWGKEWKLKGEVNHE